MADLGRIDADDNKTAKKFRQWILSLSWPDLAEAAQIPLTSQDESLLEQMIAKHVPPETPLHPKACPVKTFVFDGRSPAQCKQHRRIHRPRLLKLLEEDTASLFGEPLIQQSSGKNRHRRGGANNNNHKLSSTYTVTGENFIRSYPGENWSTPSTRDLQQADRTILDRLVLVPTRPVAEHQEGLTEEGIVQSVLCWTLDGTTGNNLAVERMYHLWRVVSRGNFGKSHGKVTKNATADWLNPTERHFSLGMYLVGRLECQLYKTFFQRRETQRHPLPRLLTEDYSGKTWQTAMTRVMMDALQHVTNDLERINQEKDTKWNPRKSALWELLDEGNVGRGQQIPMSRHSYQNSCSACSLPILLLDSTTAKLWKELRIEHRTRVDEEERLRGERRARQIQMELLQDEETVKTSTTKHSSVQKVAKSSKKRKKKKKGIARENSTNMLSNVTPPPDVQRKESSETGEIDETSTLLTEVVPTVINSREHNRNRVMALSILDDVLDRVYEKVGLGKHKNEDDGLVPVGTKAPVSKQTRFMKTKSIPVPSRQNDETVQQNNVTSSKSTSTTSPHRITPNKMAAKTSRLEEIEENKMSKIFHGETSGWPCLQSHFQPYSANGMGNGPPPGGTETGGRNLPGLSPSASYDAFAGTTWFKHDAPGTTIWEPHNYATLDQWRTLQGLGGRDRSIMEEFFRTQRDRELAKDESQMASSTIASIASSAEDVDVRVEDVMEVLDEIPSPVDLPEGYQPGFVDEDDGSTKLVMMESAGENDDQVDLVLVRESRLIETFESESHVLASDSSPAPNSKSPTQSPILVSLEDLRGFGKEMVVAEKDRDSSSHQRGPPSIKSFSSVPIVAVESLPNSPTNEQKPRLPSSLSREPKNFVGRPRHQLEETQTLSQYSKRRRWRPKVCPNQICQNEVSR